MSTTNDIPRFAQFANGTLLKQENGAYMLVSDHEKQMAELRGKLGNLAGCAAEFLATGTEEHRSDLEGALDAVGAILNEGSK